MSMARENIRLTREEFSSIIENLKEQNYWFHDFQFECKTNPEGYIEYVKVTRVIPTSMVVLLSIITLGLFCLVFFLLYSPVTIGTVKELIIFAKEVLGPNKLLKVAPMAVMGGGHWQDWPFSRTCVYDIIEPVRQSPLNNLTATLNLPRL
ncbi:hypothetical protein I4U23_021860 [Adineta vaga]|nr:hypothetical protein I4U23_021860 [Adineta vaga]